MSLINVKNLTFRYPQDERNIVNDVSFVIEKGSYTSIVGYNGSGKSTLARLISGLENPTSGTIEITEGNKIGIVFQSPKNQIVSGIISRDTAFGPQNLGLNSAEIELRTIECLNIVDMLDRAQDSSSALSLGQTQKIALSGVLALRPEILILDEAVSMLDPDSRKDILDFIKYWHKCGNTIIQITHDLEVVKDSDNVIGIEDGRIFYYGTTQNFLSDKNNLFRINGNPLPVCDKSVFNQSKKEVTFSVRNLSFIYNHSEKKCGVSDVNFDLYKGSLTALTGPSGAGKSTLLELCSGLLVPQNPQSIYSESKPVIAQQNAQAALFESFAADDVAFGPINNGKSGKELLQIVKKSMDDAAIPFEQFGERKTFELSGGEQRRLSIAGILALDSQIILFDEPTAGLDSKTRFSVMTFLRKLADEGKTVLFSTHKREEADFADREIYMEQGKIVSDSINMELSEVSKEDVQSPNSITNLLENLRNISLSLSGSQKRKKTPVEKIPAFLRIILFLILFILSLAGKSIWFCLGMLVISAIYGILSGFGLKKLLRASLKILPFLLIFSICQMIFHPALEDEIRFTTWKWFMVTPSKLLFCLASIIRTDAALACISAFFVSTPEYDLIDGLQILLKPLSILKIPVRYFILIVEIIFRFIPLLVDEASGIIKTQVIRGGLGKINGKMAKIRAVIPLIVPLIIQTIKRSEALADAITVRCFK